MSDFNTPLSPKKHFSQFFLRDRLFIQEIVQSLFPTQASQIVEIGPGDGALTDELVKYDLPLIVYEIDPEALQYLQSRYQNCTTMMLQNILHVEKLQKQTLLLGNLPYHLSTKILLWTCLQHQELHSAHFMVQKEFAEKIFANAGNTKRNYLSVIIQSIFSLKKQCDIPPGAFEPKPKVISSFFHLFPKNSLLPIPEYIAFVKKAFQKKRKTLGNIFPYLSCQKDKRPHELSTEDWLLLFFQEKNRRQRPTTNRDIRTQKRT